MLNLRPGVNFRGLFFCSLPSLFLIALVYAYWSGLGGPFILDDAPNLQSIARYLAGEVGWQNVLLENTAGLLGRQVSMYSFLLNAQVAGLEASAFKAVNLAIHLLNGVLVGWFTYLLLKTQKLSPQARLMVSILCACGWLSLAIHLSTVLYVVQRMTQLSALFSLSALIFYTHWRTSETQSRAQTIWTLLAVTAFTGLAAFSKENGILVFALIAVIELCLFQQAGPAKKRKSAQWLVLITTGLPLLFLAAFLLASPNEITNGYASRPFTLLERLLTQPLALWSYIFQITAPSSEQFGLFHDDFRLSSERPTAQVVAALLGLVGVTVFSVILRNRGPSLVACGWFIFLVGHALESTFIPLEIYFEHRNYLPSVGLVLIAAALALQFLEQSTSTANRQRRQNLALSFATLIVLANLVVVSLLSSVWSSTTGILAHAERMAPNSLRVKMLTIASLAQNQQFDAIDRVVERIRFSQPDRVLSAQLFVGQLRCAAGKTVDKKEIAESAKNFRSLIDNDDSETYAQFATLVLDKKCTGIKLEDIAAWGEAILNQSSGVPRAVNLSKIEYFTAKALAESGQVERALPYALAAWQNDNAPAIGILLFQLNATLNNRTACHTILEDLKNGGRLTEFSAIRAVEMFEQWLKKPETGVDEQQPVLLLKKL